MRILLCVFFIFSSSLAQSQDIVMFRISKVHCLLNFLETMNNGQGTSPTLRNYFNEQLEKDDTAFANIVDLYKSIDLDYTFLREEYPEHRHRHRSIQRIIFSAAIKSENLSDFNERTIGILPNSDQQKLLAAMRLAMPYYDRVIWKPHYEDLEKQMNRLQAYKSQTNEIFVQLRNFYQSEWSEEFSFIVALYPIPGKSGNSTATPYGNALQVGVLTQETSAPQRMAVVIHEMAHVLYDEQSKEFQHRIENLYLNHPSLYGKLTYTYMDEALATACGNGWAYEQLAGEADTGSWYNNEHIDGAAHAIYPLVESYIENGKSIDSIFIDKSITAFAEAFPKAIHEYSILMTELYLYADADSREEREVIHSALRKHFKAYSISTSTPINDKNSLHSMKHANATQLIILHDQPEANLEKIREIFPESRRWLSEKKDKQFILSFIDANKRAVIILKVDQLTELPTLFDRMEKEQYIQSDQPYLKVL